MLSFILFFASFLFLIGFWGILFNRHNLIVVIMSIELLLLALNFFFLSFSYHLDDFIGQLFSLLILTVAAAETSIGLSILVAYYRLFGDISLSFLHRLKG